MRGKTLESTHHIQHKWGICFLYPLDTHTCTHLNRGGEPGVTPPGKQKFSVLTTLKEWLQWSLWGHELSTIRTTSGTSRSSHKSPFADLNCHLRTSTECDRPLTRASNKMSGFSIEQSEIYFTTPQVSLQHSPLIHSFSNEPKYSRASANKSWYNPKLSGSPTAATHVPDYTYSN